MNYETLLYEVTDGVAKLTLNRAAQRNALSVKMRQEFANAIVRIRDDRAVKAVVLTGSGEAFCSGGDIVELKDFEKQSPTDNRRVLQEVHAWLPEFVNLEKPVVAAVNGAAFGAGFNMALAADFILASPQAKFCQVFARIGLVPDFGGLYLLPRIVGLQRAKDLMYSARTLGAEEALSFGIVHSIHPAATLVDAAMSFAGRFRHASTEAIGLTKAALNQAFESDQRAMAEREAYASLTAKTVPYYAEAVNRFRAKESTKFDWDRMDRENSK